MVFENLSEFHLAYCWSWRELFVFETRDLDDWAIRENNNAFPVVCWLGTYAFGHTALSPLFQVVFDTECG